MSWIKTNVFPWELNATPRGGGLNGTARPKAIRHVNQSTYMLHREWGKTVICMGKSCISQVGIHETAPGTRGHSRRRAGGGVPFGLCRSQPPGMNSGKKPENPETGSVSHPIYQIGVERLNIATGPRLLINIYEIAPAIVPCHETI